MLAKVICVDALRCLHCIIFFVVNLNVNMRRQARQQSTVAMKQRKKLAKQKALDDIARAHRVRSCSLGQLYAAAHIVVYFTYITSCS